MEKIGISTDIGLNYGSLLQAYATKQLLHKMGFEGVVLKPGGSIVKGKDIRIAKLIVTAWRMLLHSSNLKDSLTVYRSSFEKTFEKDTYDSFFGFLQNEIRPKAYTLRQLKKIAKKKEYTAFLCGSDQIWITDSFYIDPFYYLSYAPRYKRIAWAPSFGREFVPDYNKKKISKKISSIPYLSVRELSGVSVIKELTGKEAEAILDPTLMLSKEEWLSCTKSEKKYTHYLLAYFLDLPSDNVLKIMEEYALAHSLQIIGIPYTFSLEYADIVPTGIGPYEFINLINNADVVFTDSFHGTAFSLNLNVPFYTFDRNYGKAENQSTRIQSLLKITGTESRFCVSEFIDETSIDYGKVNECLKEQRKKGIHYLQSSIEKVKMHERS